MQLAGSGRCTPNPLAMRIRRLLGAVIALALVGGGEVVSTASANPVSRHGACHARTLVLSAMPVELSPLLTKEKVHETVTIHHRAFYVGRLRHHGVILALTGIGPVNARHSTREALNHFRCAKTGSRISAIVFSGVAGGDFIGNVTVPTRWTKDAGKHFYGVNRGMLRVARKLARHHRVKLKQQNGAGDPMCACVADPDTVTTVSVTHKPRIEVGGKGQTTDPFSGEHLPCVPGGGDVFGCDPCPQMPRLSEEGGQSGKGFAKFANPKFLTGYSSSSAEGPGYVAEDEETAAVDAVAHRHHLPFLGFRAVSDGGGDPLHLPGFPFQFFFYRQISADNAALTTLAFLKYWHHR
jgi:nucleoside phosphorylase